MDENFLNNAQSTSFASNNKKRLLETISYQKDIEPYGIIEILSGTGSGKNFFINKIASGVEKGQYGALEDIEKKTVLLITSRRAKANEARNDKSVTMLSSVNAWENEWALNDIGDIDEYLDSERVIKNPQDGWGEYGFAKIHQPSIALTNAGIQAYLKYRYTPTNRMTHLWQRFDLIVLDEAHSVRADASYQSAPFYVQSLVNEAYRRYRAGESKCKVIIMTGSPQIISDYSFPSDGNRIHKMNECKNTIPKKIIFVTAQQAKAILNERLSRDERIVYFYNHIGDLLKTVKEYRDSPVYDRMSVSYTDESRRKKLADKQKELYDRMIKTEQSIATDKVLPSSIQLFLTTGRNKEGINIENEDINALFVEAHAEVDVIQMAGRIRRGVDTLYVITDSRQHEKTESRFEEPFTTQEKLVQLINNYLQKVCKMDHVNLRDESQSRKPIVEYPNVNGFIEYIHEKYPYIRYDYFRDEFVVFSQRKQSIAYYKKQQTIFDRCLTTPAELKKLANAWFPNVPVEILCNTQGRVDEYLLENRWLGGQRKIAKEERDEILNALNEITGQQSKQLKTALRKLGYLLETDGKKATSPSTITKIREQKMG